MFTRNNGIRALHAVLGLGLIASSIFAAGYVAQKRRLGLIDVYMNNPPADDYEQQLKDVAQAAIDDISANTFNQDYAVSNHNLAAFLSFFPNPMQGVWVGCGAAAAGGLALFKMKMARLSVIVVLSLGLSVVGYIDAATINSVSQTLLKIWYNVVFSQHCEMPKSVCQAVTPDIMAGKVNLADLGAGNRAWYNDAFPWQGFLAGIAGSAILLLAMNAIKKSVTKYTKPSAEETPLISHWDAESVVSMELSPRTSINSINTSQLVAGHNAAEDLGLVAKKVFSTTPMQRALSARAAKDFHRPQAVGANLH